jgi:hypothetical protein
MKFSLKSCILVLFVYVVKLQISYCEVPQNSTGSSEQENVELKNESNETYISKPDSNKNCAQPVEKNILQGYPKDCFLTRKRTVKRTRTHSKTIVAGDRFCICCDIPNSSCEVLRWQKDYMNLSGSVARYTDVCIVVNETKYSDSGYYQCSTGFEPKDGSQQGLKIRVHGKLRPLWPFLVLCVQAALLGLTLRACRRQGEYTVLEDSDIE